MLPQPKRYCKVCQEEIHGRRDKQFCSDYCRSNHHNLMHADLTNLIRRVNYTIRRNRAILSQLNVSKGTRIHKRELIGQGMNFDFFTHVQKVSDQEVQYFCYDQGYMQIDEDYYKLITSEKQS